MSSSDPAISVRHIAKFFEMYDKPSHWLWQMLCHGHKQFYHPYWALRDISFDVKRGECVGIIGRNGAGKSTLLQIVTGTLTPSAGKVKIEGRVAALLELGSGFNPEFTGRDNVYLNASILGLTTKEIDERYDAIVKFADIGEFIDQPVKSYSSGMVVRLAFSVIAHVDADILIIDEALAVGDAFFTQKCMRFLRKFMAEHTVLFVSHDAAAVNNLCNRAILLEDGCVKLEGPPKEVTELYLKDMYESMQGTSAAAAEQGDDVTAAEKTAFDDEDFRDMRQEFINASNLRNDIEVFRFNEHSACFGKKGATIENVVFTDPQGTPLNWIVGGEKVVLRIFCQAHQQIYSPIIGFFVKDRLGQELFGDNTFLTHMKKPLIVDKGKNFSAAFSFVMPILAAGDYSITIAVAEGTQAEHIQHDWKHDAIMFKSTTTSCCTGIIGIPMKDINLNIVK